MSANKQFQVGPIGLTTTLTTNLLNPPVSSGGVNAGASGLFIVIKHIRVTNRTNSVATFSLWRGTSGTNAGGLEQVGTGMAVAANGAVDWYGQMRFDTPDFLVGGANVLNALTFTGEGEIGVSG